MSKYTHTDNDGILWRFEGSRPISSLADSVMSQFERKTKKSKPKKKRKKAL